MEIKTNGGIQCQRKSGSGTRGTYHIMCRGNRRSDLFRDEEDYQVYIDILKQVKEKHEFMLYTYCLMTNHIHLQLQTLNEEIWEIMRITNLKYARTLIQNII